MLLKHRARKTTMSLFLASWVVVFSLCGFDAFIPAFLGLPHHASHSTDINAECEQACLARSVSNPDTAVVQQGAIPLQPELQAVARIADSFLSNIEIFSDLPHTLIRYPYSTKLYQRVSTYRL